MYLLADLSPEVESFLQLLVAIIVFVFVIVITGLTTKFIGGYQKTRFANKNMQPLESMKVGNNKFLQLVKVGDVYLVIGVGKDEVTPIAKLTKEELPELLDDSLQNETKVSGSFQEILEKFRNRNSK